MCRLARMMKIWASERRTPENSVLSHLSGSRTALHGDESLSTSPALSARHGNRSSGASSDSPAKIHALIFDRTPPQVKRTLRHVQKDGSLRERALGSALSNRTSMNSDEPHRLVHHAKRDSLDEDFRKGAGTRSVQPQETIFSSSDATDLRPSTAPDRSSKGVTFTGEPPFVS